jgi:hypothetical protein
MYRTAPFPFTLMFRNGPRRQGCASPRKNPRALDRSVPFRKLSPQKGKGGKRKDSFCGSLPPPVGRHRAARIGME